MLPAGREPAWTARAPAEAAFRLAAILLGAALLGAGADGARAAGPSDLEIAGECAAASRQTLQQNVGGGVYNERAQVATPVTIAVPSGVDAGSYERCLDLHGLRPDVRRDPYLAVLEKCRAGLPPQRRFLLGGDGTRHVVVATDQDAVAACVREHLGEIKVEVEHSP